MPILNRIRSFLASPQGRRVTDEGMRMARNRGGRRQAPGRAPAPGQAHGRGLLSSLLRRR